MARSVEIWGHGELAEATTAAARSLGWEVAAGPDVIVVAPLGPTVQECDALIARPSHGQRAFAWPMVSVTAVQQMIGRCRSIGELTHMSSQATRPTIQRGHDRSARVLHAAHDQVALLLLLAQIAGAGAPSGATLHSTDRLDLLTIQIGDLAATVEIRWDDSRPPTLDVQVAGVDGVLRIDTDPSTRLEHNGEPVPLPTPEPTAPALQPLRDAGVVDMLKTIGAVFFEDRPLAHAFSFEFGRSVVAIIEGAVDAQPD